MGVFDIGTGQGYQSAAATVATALVPKKTAAQSLGAGAPGGGLKANAASAAGSAPSSTTSSVGGTITSNDFLTLLVSELKNQDPTQPTDPNAYITQLVGVNSLQQLISINKGIGTLDSGSGTKTNAAALPVS